MTSLRILSGGGELFDIPVPEGAARERVAAAVELLTAGSTGPGRERLAALLEPLFPRKYRRSLFNLSGEDALRLGRALLPSFPCPAPARPDLSAGGAAPAARTGTDGASREGEVPQRRALLPEFPPPAEEIPAEEAETIALAFAFKWTLEYAASLPPRLRAGCLEYCRLRRERSAPAETAFTPEELARAVARNAAALEKFRGADRLPPEP